MSDLTQVVAEQIPPHNLEAERAVLGALLLDPSGLTTLLQKLQPDDFYLERHRVIYRGILSLQADEQAVDAVTLTARLRDLGTLDEAGGAAEIAGLIDAAALAVHVDAYVALILDGAVKREIIQAAVEAVGHSYNGTGSTKILEALTGRLTKLSDRSISELDQAAKTDHTPIAVALGDALEATLEDLRTSVPDFVATPIPTLTRKLSGGFLPGELIYLGGEPSAGKTALALEMAICAGEHGNETLIISAEMKAAALGRRILAQQAQVSASAFRKGDLDLHEWERVKAVLPRLKGLPVWLTDEAYSVRQVIRMVKRMPTLRFLIVDYLQLLSGGKSENKRLEVEDISHSFKRMCHRHPHLSACVLSSMTSAFEERGKRKPGTLRESRGLHFDADIILLLWRPDETKETRELIIKKARDGPTGMATLMYTAQYLKFLEVSDRERSSEET